MKIERFEDIVAWQKAKDLVFCSYRYFSQIRDFGFKDQILRAAVSVMNNIAEGYERMGNKEFKKFLYIAKGSCGEVRSMLYIALELKYIDKNKFGDMESKCLEISRMLSGFIKKLQ